MTGKPSVVMQKARTITASIPVCFRMNRMPSFMLVMIGSRVLAGTKKL